MIEAVAVSVIGWAAWGVVAAFIAAFDYLLMRFGGTSLSDTWKNGHGRVMRPLEMVTFLALGAHLFYGTPIVPVILSAVATFGVGVYTVRKAAKHVQ